MKASYIIPIYIFSDEALDMTKWAITSMKQADNSAEMVIVDNNSSFGGGYLRSEADIYVRNKENVGFCPAVNQGLKLAHGEILVPTNNDVRVSPNWKGVAEEILENPKVGSVHFRMTEYDIPFAYGDKTWKTGRERWCTTSFFVIRREALPEGLWDENYGLGGFDDWDFWHRVRHINGWQMAYTTKACYQHKDSFTYLALNQDQRRDRDNTNREYFKKKWGQYPEDIWMEKYPKQMEVNWRRGFDEL